MSREPNQALIERVGRAMSRVLIRDRCITYPKLLCEMGVLSREDLDSWRRGKVSCLERVIRMNLTRLGRVQTAVRRLAMERGLRRGIVPALPLRPYSKTGHPLVEEEYCAVYREGNPKTSGI
jgi:hypothetical protein